MQGQLTAWMVALHHDLPALSPLTVGLRRDGRSTTCSETDPWHPERNYLLSPAL